MVLFRAPVQMRTVKCEVRNNSHLTVRIYLFRLYPLALPLIGSRGKVLFLRDENRLGMRGESAGHAMRIGWAHDENRLGTRLEPAGHARKISMFSAEVE